jgi:uncharacterized protein YbaR (Trm112 family)
VSAPATPAVDSRLLELLVCPLTRTALEWRKDQGELVSRAARLAFPVRNGVPVMLVSEARPLDEDAPGAG